MTTNDNKKPASAQSDLIEGFAVVLERMEREAFEKWADEAQKVNEMDAYEKIWAWAAWKGRSAHIKPCRGISHDGCDYLSPCGSICNKCGQAV